MVKRQEAINAPRIERRVLIVEDEKNQRQMLTRAVTEMEFEVEAVASAEDALELIDSFTPTVALLDLSLPGMDGLELAGLLQKRLPLARFIFLTGYGDLDAARQAIRLDAVDFLLKPCPLGELEAAVSRAYLKANEITPDLPAIQVTNPVWLSKEPPDSNETIDGVERRLIAESLARHKGNRAAVARELGISVRTLYYRLARYESEDRHDA